MKIKLISTNILLAVAILLTGCFSGCKTNDSTGGIPVIRDHDSQAKIAGRLTKIASRRLVPVLGDDADIILKIADGLEIAVNEGNLKENQIELILTELGVELDGEEAKLLVQDITDAYGMVYDLWLDGLIDSENTDWVIVRGYMKNISYGLREGYNFHLLP